MKKGALVALAVITGASMGQAESVYVPQAVSIVKARQMEAGVAAQFGYQSSEIVGSAGTTYKNRVWQVPVFARYGITDDAEAKLVVPVVNAIDSSEGLSSTHYKETGFGNLQMGAKWNFLKGSVPLAAALDLDLPTANSSHNRASLGNRYNNQLQQGFNGHLQMIADSPVLQDMVMAHAQVGYMNTATYTTTSRLRFNPSDLFTFGLSVDMNLKRMAEGLSLSGEVVGNSALNHSKTHGTVNGNDKGTVLEAGPSVRYTKGAVRTFAGFLVDEGKATFRAYNYRVNFGCSLLFGGH